MVTGFDDNTGAAIIASTLFWPNRQYSCGCGTKVALGPQDTFESAPIGRNPSGTLSEEAAHPGNMLKTPWDKIISWVAAFP